jgi:hypothetical protein
MPRLDLQLLKSVGAESVAKHDHGKKIRDAFAQAELFNANYKDNTNYSEPERREQLKRLDGILELAGEWLTAKPLKQEGGAISQAKSQKNAARWQALAKICEQCSNELIEMGYRPLSGHWMENPLNGPSDHPNYWLERLDPKHRGAAVLKGEYATWSLLKPGETHADKSFFEFVDATRPGLPSVRYDKGTADADAQGRVARRAEAQVMLQGGKLHKIAPGNVPGPIFDSSGLKTEFAGQGFAIFVWDHKRRLYSGLHIANALHHSTPRGGRPVLCAGEWKADPTGAIVMITSKTGHYTTTPKEFKTFLEYLKAENALTNQAICVPDTSGQTKGSWNAYGALDWLNGGMVPKTKASILQAVPGLDQDLKSRNFWLRLAG